MIKTLVYYKYSHTFATKPNTVHRFSILHTLYVVTPYKINNYVLQPNTLYVAIEYNNACTDSFVFANFLDAEALCFHHIYVGDAIWRIPPSTLFVDIELPFKPDDSILRRLQIFTISTNRDARGLYRLTFVRKCHGSVAPLLQCVREDVETYIPDVPVLVTAIYSALWFRRG